MIKPFALPALLYDFAALEPYIDVRTMEIHYAKHHQAYVDKLNAAVGSEPSLADKTLEALLSNLEAVPEAIRPAVRNNGGGHWNHAFFWEIMAPASAPASAGEPQGELAQAIINAFGGFPKFKESFTQAGLNRFGSGWAWLALQKGKLAVYSTPNQDNPAMQGDEAILGADVWEHAYYLKYQNRRQEYLDNWWNVINWQKVSEIYQQSVKQNS